MKEFFETHWFLIMVLAIASIGSFVWLFVFNKEKLHAKWWEILLVSITHTLFGVLMVKFFALIEAGFNSQKAGSMSLYGGIFFMPIYYLIYAKIKKLPLGLVFDIFAVCLAFTLMMARINCFHAGCCLGKVNPETGNRYPTREIDTILNALFTCAAIILIFKNKLNCLIYPSYMMYYAAGRFVLEFFRVSSSTNALHIAHIWSIVSFVIGSLILIINLYRKNRDETK